MENHTQQFNLLVEKAASEKAFSLDVLKTINEMRDRFEALVKENEERKQLYDVAQERIKELQNKYEVSELKRGVLETKEKQLNEGLEKLSRDQFELDLMKNVVDHGEKIAISCLQTVFANSTLRKTVNRSFNSHYDSQKGSLVNDLTPYNETETIEEA